MQQYVAYVFGEAPHHEIGAETKREYEQRDAATVSRMRDGLPVPRNAWIIGTIRFEAWFPAPIRAADIKNRCAARRLKSHVAQDLVEGPLRSVEPKASQVR